MFFIVLVVFFDAYYLIKTQLQFDINWILLILMQDKKNMIFIHFWSSVFANKLVQISAYLIR